MTNDPHRTARVDDVAYVDFPHTHSEGIDMCAVCNNVSGILPFAVRRVFYILGVPEGDSRGAHSHFVERQVILVLKGEFNVEVCDGSERRVFHVDSPSRGLYVPPGLWRRIHDFSADAVCLVLSSTDYDESDYVRDFDRFLYLTSLSNE